MQQDRHRGRQLLLRRFRDRPCRRRRIQRLRTLQRLRLTGKSWPVNKLLPYSRQVAECLSPVPLSAPSTASRSPSWSCSLFLNCATLCQTLKTGSRRYAMTSDLKHLPRLGRRLLADAYPWGRFVKVSVSGVGELVHMFVIRPVGRSRRD